jgi:hypothetical protein
MCNIGYVSAEQRIYKKINKMPVFYIMWAPDSRVFPALDPCACTVIRVRVVVFTRVMLASGTTTSKEIVVRVRAAWQKGGGTEDKIESGK